MTYDEAKLRSSIKAKSPAMWLFYETSNDDNRLSVTLPALLGKAVCEEKTYAADIMTS